MFEGIGKLSGKHKIQLTENAEPVIHPASLREVLEKAQKSGLKLNKKKCEFGVWGLTHLGHKLSGKGVQPDPDKTNGGDATTNKQD